MAFYKKAGAAQSTQRYAAEVLQQRRLTWLEMTITEANLATGKAAGIAARVAA